MGLFATVENKKHEAAGQQDERSGHSNNGSVRFGEVVEKDRVRIIWHGDAFQAQICGQLIVLAVFRGDTLVA